MAIDSTEDIWLVTRRVDLDLHRVSSSGLYTYPCSRTTPHVAHGAGSAVVSQSPAVGSVGAATCRSCSFGLSLPLEPGAMFVWSSVGANPTGTAVWPPEGSLPDRNGGGLGGNV